MSGLNSNYITGPELEDYFVSNQNGEALAHGVVTFYEDTNRSQGKVVFELTFDSLTNQYSYTPLPNPIILSAVGTFQDASGDNVAVYYYPYDEFGNLQLYYITVYDQFGNLQFTREAWPFPNVGGGSSTISNSVGLENQLSNPQFALINFVSPLSYTIAGAGTLTIPIAPDWDLTIITTGASTLSVTQTPVVGQSRLPFNPPFTLDVTYGANVTSCQLIQTLNNNPDWAAPQVTGVMGYLSGSILIGNGTSVSMQYKPNAGNPAQTILDVTNTSGAYVQENGTIQLEAANNTSTGATGFDEIIINLLSQTSSISNVQVIPLTENISGVQYDQTPVNRQIDHLFNYYDALLQYKPIKSLLVGWDFPLNPAQINGFSVASQALGANTSYYAWDQTIIFQSVDNSVAVSRTTGGDLVLTASADTQVALIQYLPLPEALQFLYTPLSVNILAVTSQDGGATAIVGTVSLWYTSDVSLPDLNSPNYKSIVATLDANGYPATFNGTWTEIGRSGSPTQGSLIAANTLGKAQFHVFEETSHGAFDSISFNGWCAVNAGDNHAETFVAVVVGFATLANTKSITIKSISVVPGQIPTIPAPQTLEEVQHACEYYYEKSFETQTAPATGVTAGQIIFVQGVGAATGQAIPSVSFKTRKRNASYNLTIYNPVSANNQIRNYATNTDWSATTAGGTHISSFYLTATSPGGSGTGQTCAYQWVADNRLGIV
jgi:hypothetical protein